jgi:DNA-binding NarL/FixJ family response regulator
VEERLLQKKILVVATDTLPGAGLEILLSREADLEVISLASEVETDLIEAIKLYKPDAVVIDQKSLTKEVTISRLLTVIPNSPLILVSTESNYIQIYIKHEILLTKAADLADVIRSF